MRISSLQIFDIARRSMADASQEMTKTQEQLSTGKRVLTPADDPVAATKILQLTDELSSIDQYLKNIDIAETNLSLEESVLKGVTGVIQRMQELAVSAGNTATLTPSEYKAMASEVGTRLDEMVNLMNTQNAGGDYIFGGYKSTQPPFEGNTFSGFQYQGDEGRQLIKVAANTTVAATDSGKELFMDVGSSNPTVDTSASSANRSSPPAQISVGQVIDREAFEEFYPKDMVITFNAQSAVSPPGQNYTVTERTSGQVIAANQQYVGGETIELNGVQLQISGNPQSGTAATPANRNFGADLPQTFPVDFSPPNNQTFSVTVGGRTERLVLDSPIANLGDLVNTLNDPVNGNANRLDNLDLTVDAQGFQMPLGVNMSFSAGTAEINDVLGLDTVNGSQSNDGVTAQPGDRFFVESSEKQGILTTLTRFKNAMENYDGSAEGKEALSDVVAETLDNLGNAHTSVLEVQTSIGARINTLDSTRDLHLDTEVLSKEVLSRLRDVDWAEATTRMSQQTLILQAAQQSFLRVSQLNLFSQL